jgi:hypothetical protein
MYDFCALGERLAEKHGLYKVEKEFETDYFLIQNTSFAWSEVLRTFPHNDYIVFFNAPEKVEDRSKYGYEYCFGSYRPEQMNEHFGIDIGVARIIDNQIKEEHVKHFPEIDFVKLLDDILTNARKNLNDLLINTKKSEIKGAGSKYIL